ncbi:ATP-binding protein [Sphingomonas sanguinis]|uniref:histidine kinase n=1 Tax=Sphingomonas sanguinis TaxID=33051 RepID=A0ABU5LKH3_9SPHN|nr:ATP-binding protein [Sphingomonas sanguinis]MDZ7280426.1 ATP-binding protein [Sphingomonas sanguinis]
MPRKDPLQANARALRWITGAAVALLILAIFVVDVLTDRLIAVAVLYVVPVLLSLRAFPRAQVTALAAGCVVLTMLGTPLTRFGMTEAGVVNLAISIVAIVTTGYLGLRTLSHEAASHEAREHLRRLSRIGNLGELASSIAHEVNQPLAAIAGSAGACRRWLEATPPDLSKAKESLDRISRDAARAGDVVAGVRRLASRKAATPEWTDMGELVEQCVAIARAELDRQQIRLDLDLPPEGPLVWGDRVQIQQIVLNLLINAIESLGENGAAERRILVMVARNDSMIVLSVADTGPGLSRDAAGHLWEPFWTSKDGGVGLGLTISRTIAEAHGGALECRPRGGAGAVFELRLPMAQEDTHG